MRVQTALGIAQREVLDRHAIGVVELDQRPRPVARDGREELRHARGAGRTGNEEALIEAETEVGAARYRHRIDHRINAGDDHDPIARHEVVDAHEVGEIGLGRR